jgi:acetyl-CoA synthetase
MLERIGVNPQDRVAIVSRPSLEFYVTFYGVLKRGAVAVPCYSLLGPEGLEYRIRDSNAKVVVIGKERADLVPSDSVSHVIIAEELRELIQKEDTTYEPNTSADTLALIQFTSGTTGLPKQILYTHGAVSVTAVYVKFWLGLRENDVYMCTSSPAWGHGIWYGTVGPLIFGNGIGAYSGKFNPEVFLQALEEFEVTVVSAIPRVYAMIMNSGLLVNHHNLKLRRLTHTGSAIDVEVQKYFQEKVGIMSSSNYGNTEVGPIVIDFAFDDYKPRLGSAGRPMFGTTVASIDEEGNELHPGQVGELSVRRKGKWQPVGDSGYVDEDGYVWSLGRSDDVIKSSGYRIGPFEIECVLAKHPAVAEVAVVGSPDKERGEIVKAFVVGNQKPNAELDKELQGFVKERLSMHEYPKEIEFVDELPMTPDGKIQRKILKERERAKKGFA